MSFKVTWKTHIICFILSLSGSMLFQDAVAGVVAEFVSSYMVLLPITGSMIPDFFIWVAALTLFISIIHELIHGCTYKLFGGKVRFGFKGIYAYTREISGLALERFKFAAVLLSPLAAISLFMPFFGSLGRMLALINILGSSGDIYMVYVLLKFKKGCMVEDKSYGFDVYYPQV